MAFPYPLGAHTAHGTRRTQSLWFNLKVSMVSGICLLLTMTRLLASRVSRWAKLVIGKGWSGWKLINCSKFLVAACTNSHAYVKEGVITCLFQFTWWKKLPFLPPGNRCALQATVSAHCSAAHLSGLRPAGVVMRLLRSKVLKLWTYYISEIIWQYHEPKLRISISKIWQCHDVKLWTSIYEFWQCYGLILRADTPSVCTIHKNSLSLTIRPQLSSNYSKL